MSTGDYDHPKVRFPGSFGSAYLYYVVPKVILFRTEHSRRTLVPKVDFISAPGTNDANVYRPGGPVALVTNRCLSLLRTGVSRWQACIRATRSRKSSRTRDSNFDMPAQRARDAGTVARNAQAHARGDRAAIGGGLSAIRGAGVRCRPDCFRTLKIAPFRSFYTWASVPPRGRPVAAHHKKRKERVW